MLQRIFPRGGTCNKQVDDMLIEQVKLLYAGLPQAIVISLVLALILCKVQYAVIDPARIWLWLAIIGAILAARAVLAQAWRRNAVFASDAFHWLGLFRIGVIATGAAWGVGAVLLFPAGNITYQAYLSFVIAGIGAGAITALAVDVVSVLGFLVLTLVPLIVRFIIEDSGIAAAMGVMVAIFLFIISANAVNARRSLLENFRLRIQAQEQEQVLRLSEARLNQAQRTAHIGNWELDLVSSKLYWSDEIYRIFEIEPTKLEASYQVLLDVIHPEDRDRVNKAYIDSLANRQPYDIIHRLLFADGRIKFIHERCETQCDAVGKPLRSLGTMQDVTEQQSAQSQLRESELRFRFMLETSPIAVCITSVVTGQVLFANRRYAALINSMHDEVIGINPEQYYANPQDYAEVLEYLGKGEQVTNKLVELIISHEPAEIKWALASYLKLEYQQQQTTLGWFYDISELMEADKKMQHLAFHDPLTDLPNRMLFIDRLQHALAIAKRDGTRLALMFIDLDKFKPINDTYGHNVGDQVLKGVAQRIKECLRDSDTVGRVGGDEFVVLLPIIKTENDVLEVAEKIRYSLNQPFDVAGYNNLRISSSMGIALYPEQGVDENQLLMNADDAMYYAKSTGRNNVQIYRLGMNGVKDR